MTTVQANSLDTLFAVASELTKKQLAMQAMLAGSPDPKLLLELSKSIREISRINRQIAERIRLQGRERREELLLVQLPKTIAA